MPSVTDGSRRRLLKGALAGAAATIGALTMSRAQQKMTKAQAQYQETPKGDILMCGTCSLFEPPNACKVMEGEVVITGWCNAFDLAD